MADRVERGGDAFVPRRGIASDTLGRASVTMLWKTVSESRMVTPKNNSESRMVTP